MEWLFGGAKIRYFGPRPLIENSSVRLLASYPLSARLGHKFENGLIVRICGLKLLNQEASQACAWLLHRRGRGRPHSAREPGSSRHSPTKAVVVLEADLLGSRGEFDARSKSDDPGKRSMLTTELPAATVLDI
jgi:hypothetical protein